MATAAERAPLVTQSRTTRRVIVVVSLALLVAALFVMLLPFVWMVATSFKPEAEVVRFPPELLPGTVTFEHYVDIWQRIAFGRMFLNTLIFAGGVTIVSLLFDSLTAYALARMEFPGRNVLFILILATMMLPFQVTLIPIFELLTKADWINTYQGLIVPRATNAFGIFFLRQFFLSIPKDLEDAARVDGASEFRIYAQIVMPLCRPALAALAIFTFTYHWDDFYWPLIIVSSEELRTLPLGLALFVVRNRTAWDLLMAGSVITTVPVLLVFLFFQRHFIRGIAVTGMK